LPQRVITTDIGVFENALKTQDITPQQQIARDLGQSEALRNVESVADPRLEIARAIKDIRTEAERTSILSYGPFMATQKLFEAIASPILPDALGSPRSEARYARERIEEMIDQSIPMFGSRPADQERQVQQMREQLKVIERLEQLSQRLEQNTEEVRKNNNLLQQDVQTNTTGTIQRQQEQRK
jgi:hypothetical protein